MRGVCLPSHIKSCIIFCIAVSVLCGIPWTFARYWVCLLTIACAMRRLPYRAGCILSHHSRSFLVRSMMGSHGVRSLIWLPIHAPRMSRFPLALSLKTTQMRSCTRCGSTHVTLGVDTRKTRRTLTGIRTMKITAWRLDALSSPDRRH
jgi:hypothetical protein